MNVDKIVNDIGILKKNQVKEYYNIIKGTILGRIDFYYDKDYAKFFIDNK